MYIYIYAYISIIYINSIIDKTNSFLYIFICMLVLNYLQYFAVGFYQLNIFIHRKIIYFCSDLSVAQL